MIYRLLICGLCLGLVLPLNGTEVNIVGKAKRYLSHGSSPCPPFYPNFGHHEPMHASRPYGPPAYPKLDIRPVPYTPEFHIKPATYHVGAPAYEAKQPIYHQPVKQEIYQPPVMQISHYPVIKPAIVEASYHQAHPVYTPTYSHPPVHNYAPYYPAKWLPPMPEPKKVETPKVTGIVYKPEPPKCPVCSPHPPQQISKPTQPIFYSKIIKPVLQPDPPKIYLPAHQPCH